MHPFWAVRRLTAAALQLAKTAAEKEKSTKPMLRFNCTTEARNLSVICVASVDGKCFNKTRILETPFLVNFEPLEGGEELILEVAEKAKKEPAKRSWRDAEKERENAEATAKRQKTDAAKRLDKVG